MYDYVDRQLQLYSDISRGIIPPGYTVKGYVRSTGIRTSDSAAVQASFYTSVATALAACTSETQQIILVLPGHSEAVGTTLFTAAATGVKIVGVGDPAEDTAPTLLWSGASSNLAVAAKNTVLANLRMVANANDITEGITVTGAGFRLLNCYVQGAASSAADFVIFLNISTGADDCLVAGNTMRATPASNAMTNFIKCATVVDDTKIVGNRVFGLATSTTVGPVHVSAASTNMLIAGNMIDNQVASSVGSLTFTDVACTGMTMDNYCTSQANAATITSQGVTTAGSTNILMHFNQNFSSDGLKATSGVVTPLLTT